MLQRLLQILLMRVAHMSACLQTVYDMRGGLRVGNWDLLTSITHRHTRTHTLATHVQQLLSAN